MSIHIRVVSPMTGGGGTGGEALHTHTPPAVPSRSLVPGVGVIWRHAHAIFGEPIPALCVWV